MIKHIFFDRSCVIDKELADRSNIELALKNRGINFFNIAFVKQVHDANVLLIDEKSKVPQNQGLPECDSIVTNLKNLAIAIVTADCGPILLQDEKANVIAAVHAGWKGAKKNIITNAIKAMEKLGAKRSHIVANIGPMIFQESYQITQEFFDDFVKEDKNFAKFFVAQEEQGRYLFDLPAFVNYKLQQEKIKEINDTKINTYTNQDYASYRRGTHQGIKEYGRNVSLIIMGEKSGA